MADSPTHPPTASRHITVHAPSVTGLPPMREYVHDIWIRRPFMWHLARTSLKARHYATVMGQVWIILDPMLMAAVYFMLRTVVRPAGTPEERGALIAHLIMGVMVYHFTSGSLTSGARSITSNQQMVLNTAFPRAIFPMVAVATAFLDFLPTSVVLLATQVLLGQPIGLQLLFFPVVIIVLAVFNLGLAFLWAPITVFFRDAMGFLPYITQMWLYATPVLYRISEMPEGLKDKLRFNPLFPFFSILEAIFTGNWPDPFDFLHASFWAVFTLAVGVYVFLSKEREFAIRI